MLTAGRHGGLQNMEVRGIVMLRITDPNLAKISISYDNNDNKGFQMQVSRFDIFYQNNFFLLCLYLLSWADILKVYFFKCL